MPASRHSLALGLKGGDSSVPILIILVVILIVIVLGSAVLEAVGNMLGLTIFAGASIVKRIRDRRARKMAERAAAAADPAPRRIEISCPCSAKFQVNIKKPGGPMFFTCPTCGQKLRVDTSKMVK